VRTPAQPLLQKKGCFIACASTCSSRSSRGLFTALLLISPVAATATPFTNADYSVRVSAVTTPNQPQTIVGRSQDQQRSFAPQLTTRKLLSRRVD